jgi:nucleoside-diphosphate-sugar epimerase
MNSLAGQIVAVTGATGFLGGALTRRLVTEGVTIRALVRNIKKADALRKMQGVEIVGGDLQDAAALRKLTEGCSVVFHVAAALGGPLAHQERSNVEGTRQLAQAAGESGVKRVVYVSSIAAYGYGISGVIAEETEPKPGRVAYNITKLQGEQVTREVSKHHGFEYAIIRPGMIYGPGSNAWTRTLFRVAQGWAVLFPGDGSGTAYPIHVDDVVDLILVLGQHPEASGEAFNCAPDPSPTWREWLLGYAQLAGHERWLGLPMWPIRAAAPLIEAILSAQGGPQDLPALVQYVVTQRTYSMKKAAERLGWRPKIDLASGLQSCVPWLRQQGLLA